MSIFDTIVTDIETAWSDVDHFVESEAAQAWGLFEPTLTTFVPAELIKLQGLVAGVIGDVEKGDLVDLETAVLNAAEAAGEDFLHAVESGVLQPILGVIAGKLGWLKAA